MDIACWVGLGIGLVGLLWIIIGDFLREQRQERLLDEYLEHRR